MKRKHKQMLIIWVGLLAGLLIFRGGWMTYAGLLIFLLDLVLGYGASRTPEKDFVEELAKYRAQHPDEYVAVIVSVCGSKDDP